jgi:hypothetical protein
MIKVKGRIVEIDDLKQGVSRNTGKPWCAQSYVLKFDGEESKCIMFTIFGADKIQEAGLSELLYREMEIELDIESKQFNNKWYTNAYFVRTVNILD